MAFMEGKKADSSIKYLKLGLSKLQLKCWNLKGKNSWGSIRITRH
jgi:hypothetical protein